MHIIYVLRRIAALSVLSAFAMLPAAALAQAPAPTTVEISQIYGGGGNSGATLTTDFIELFNPTGSTQVLTGYSIQYASATSANAYQVGTLPSKITLAPGQYFLIAASQGAGGTVPLPTPDATVSLSLSATAGKVALVSSTTALNGTNGCPTNDPSVVDYIGFGGTTTAVNCSLGTPAPVLTNTTAAVRKNVCVNTKDNGADFEKTSGVPVPHNESSAFTPCVLTGPQPLAASAVATPAMVFTGSPSLLTVHVSPATEPSSSNIQVQANLGTIGGLTTQSFFDDGSNGDITAGDNIFSYSATANSSGAFSFPVTVTDSQARSAQTSISLTVQTPPQFVTIRTIQANKPSTYATQTITTSGVVIGVKSNGFYLEAKDADTTPVTPEGILIYTGSTKLPSYITVGAEVQVTGVVATYPPTSLTPGTEIDGPQSFTLLTASSPLPTPIKISAAMDSPSGGIKQFAKYEGMRVAIDSLTTTSGTDASLNEQTETNTSNGLFYGVVTSVPRPFREPGVSITDTTYTLPLPPAVPLWDSNPELLYIDSHSFGGPAVNLTSNATVTGITGVMDFSGGSPEILVDANAQLGVTGLMTPQPVPVAGAGQFTIASFNMERFYNDVADQDNPGSSSVVVTTEAYQRRLNKASLAIRNMLNFPDILGTEEIENLAVLTDLANKVNADAKAAGQTDPAYKPYLFLATDGTAINTGFLVKSTRVDTINAEQFGLATTFTNSVGSQAILNDRTPLVLHAGIKRAAGQPDFPITVICVHQRSLISVDDPTSTGATVRLKREKQAEYLASLIQSYQAQGEHVVAVGDFNSFEFSDGFVDVMGVTEGTPAPADQVVVSGPALVNPSLVDLVTLLPPQQRQSYVETGSAQVLDHIIITRDLLPLESQFVYAHLDSDFPLVNLNDATSPTRISDHDPAVVYFTIPAVASPAQLATTATLSKVAGGYQAIVTIHNSGTGTAQNVQLTAAVLGSANGTPLPQSLGDIAGGASAVVTLTFPSTAGASGATVVERFTGTYTGGVLGGSIRVVLP
jgi:predicted extracellular nuclease